MDKHTEDLFLCELKNRINSNKEVYIDGEAHTLKNINSNWDVVLLKYLEERTSQREYEKIDFDIIIVDDISKISLNN